VKIRPNQRLERQPIYSGVSGFLARAVDAVVGAVAPGVAHNMRKARVRSEALLAYEAAKIDRTNPITRVKGADQDIMPDLLNLRSLSRSTVRDDAHADGIVRTFEDNVVGNGIRPQSCVNYEQLGITADQAKEWAKIVEAEWERWCDEEADATEEGSFYDLQKLVVRTRKIDGEVLSHAIIGGDATIRCELIDVDRLESPGFLDTAEIKGGVEVDSKGAPLAYHILDKHPDDTAIKGRGGASQRIDAKLGDLSIVQHVKRRGRPGQTRGVPDFASALLYKKHLHHYLNSELIAARAASNYALFIEQEPDTTDPDIFPVQAEESGQTMEFHEILEAGTIRYLNKGEKPVPFSPNRPGAQFDQFVTRILRAIAAAQGVSYELVAKDFGGMNYSSARAMLLECRRAFDSERGLLIRQFCMPWWRNVILRGVASGRLKAPPKFLDNPRAWLRVRWVAPSYGWVDPTKEIEASSMAVAANLSNPYDEAARSGVEAEANLEARARFLERAAELEIERGLPAGSLSAIVPPPAPAPGDGGGGDPSNPDGQEPAAQGTKRGAAPARR
jgi:lambda family phage portal protein